MRIAGTAFIGEGLRAYASHRQILRTYLVIPCSLAVTLLVAWPQGTAEGAFRGGAATDAFSVVAVTFLLLLLYLGGRYGEEHYSPDALADLREYATLTPASVASVVTGKAAFALVHTLFLLALGAPFLLASFSVSGAGPGSLAACLGILAAATFAARLYGLLLLAAFGTRNTLRGATFISTLAVFLFASWFLLPAVNPIAVVLAVNGEAGGVGVVGARVAAAVGLSPSAFLVLFALAAALLFAVAAAFILGAARRAARGGGAARD